MGVTGGTIAGSETLTERKQLHCPYVSSCHKFSISALSPKKEEQKAGERGRKKEA